MCDNFGINAGVADDLSARPPVHGGPGGTGDRACIGGMS